MHSNDDVPRILYEGLGKHGYRGKFASIQHVNELGREIEAHYQNGLLDPELYNLYLASFDLECQQKLSDAKSLIIVSVPQPQVQVAFDWKGKCCPIIIPPTYAFSTDKHVANLLEAYLEPQGYQLKKVRLPEKLLAVRSGLAQYGKNNITYVKEMGSFHRPAVFITDFPCPEESWGEPSALEHCEKCTACMKACPTDAIGSDRFLLHAERCITFHNERRAEFPDWLSPAWHNCLVGCMICQKVCPANKDVVKWIEESARFDHQETDFLLDERPRSEMPRDMITKLEQLGLMEYFDVLGRNLKVLLENHQKRSSKII
jgi:epoxyqueuosine reductase